MEYCCHVWACTCSCHLELLDKLQKWICRTVVPSLAASLEPLVHCRNLTSLSLFYRYFLGRCSSELAELVPLCFSPGRSTRCHIWSCTCSCYLEFLDKLQKRICRTAVLSVAACLESLVYHRNLASLSLFYRYFFGRCSSELAQLVPLAFSLGRSTRCCDRLHDFFVTIPRSYKDVNVNSFFPGTGRLCNSLPLECFPLTYDFRGFKPRINSYLLTAGSF